MHTGVYRKIAGRTGVGLFYLVLFPMRHHKTGIESVAYVPLRVEPEWERTLRVCYLEREDFNKAFVYVAEGLPSSDVITETLAVLKDTGAGAVMVSDSDATEIEHATSPRYDTVVPPEQAEGE
jgi:hypothetical protein